MKTMRATSNIQVGYKNKLYGKKYDKIFKFDKNKFKELILYICNQYKDDVNFNLAKLSQILFLCDFESYGAVGEAITGAKYFKGEVYPVPQNFLNIIKEMEDEGIILLTVEKGEKDK